jgi:hypothetical protein
MEAFCLTVMYFALIGRKMELKNATFYVKVKRFMSELRSDKDFTETVDEGEGGEGNDVRIWSGEHLNGIYPAHLGAVCGSVILPLVTDSLYYSATKVGGCAQSG